jgi:hypothetical protein
VGNAAPGGGRVGGAEGAAEMQETRFLPQYLRQEGHVDTQRTQPLQAIGFINRQQKTLSGFSGRDFSTAASFGTARIHRPYRLDFWRRYCSRNRVSRPTEVGNAACSSPHVRMPVLAGGAGIPASAAPSQGEAGSQVCLVVI